MLWPLERAVHARDVEQRLMNLDVQLFRMQQEAIALPIGYAPTSNNFPLPPIPDDSCTTNCVSGEPTIEIGATGYYAHRRLSILGANATQLVYLDYDSGDGFWTSDVIPLITPLVCSGQSVNLRWKLTATGIFLGEVTLILQYQVPIIGPAWNDGPTWNNNIVWDTACGLTFSGGAGFDPGLSCNQAAPTTVCVNPVGSGDKVLVYTSGAFLAPRGFITAMNAVATVHTSQSEPLGAYGVIVFRAGAFPSWWGQLGTTWSGRVVVCSDWSDFGANAFTATAAPGMTVNLGSPIDPNDFSNPTVTSDIETHALTSGVASIKFRGAGSVTGGTPLVNYMGTPFISVNVTSGVEWVLCGDSNMFSGDRGEAVHPGDVTFFQNLAIA